MNLKRNTHKLKKLLKEITSGAIAQIEEPIVFAGFKKNWEELIHQTINELSFSRCIKDIFWGIHGLHLIIQNKCPESLENMRLEFRKLLTRKRLNLPFVIKYENFDYITESTRLSSREDKFIFELTKLFSKYLTTKDEEKKKELRTILEDEVSKITKNPEELFLEIEKDEKIQESAKKWGDTPNLKSLVSRKIRDFYIKSIYEYVTEKKGKAWKKLPAGWTMESLKSFWKSLGGDFYSCVEKISDTDITDPKAFCASLSRKLFGEVI